MALPRFAAAEAAAPPRFRPRFPMAGAVDSAVLAEPAVPNELAVAPVLQDDPDEEKIRSMTGRHRLFSLSFLHIKKFDGTSFEVLSQRSYFRFKFPLRD